MPDDIGLAAALLGLGGFRVVEVVEVPGELTVVVETIADRAFCAEFGCRAEAQDRMPVELRDLPCFGRPVRLAWQKRRWRCREPLCSVKTWTEGSEAAPRRLSFRCRRSPRSVADRRSCRRTCRTPPSARAGADHVSRSAILN